MTYIYDVQKNTGGDYSQTILKEKYILQGKNKILLQTTNKSNNFTTQKTTIYNTTKFRKYKQRVKLDLILCDLVFLLFLYPYY